MDEQVAALNHEDPGFRSAYVSVLNLIHQQVDPAVLKQELVAYATTIGLSDAAESIPANRIGVEGKIAFCLNRGAKLSSGSIERVRTTLMSAGTPTSDAPMFEELPETAHHKAVRAYVGCYSLIDNAKTLVLKGKLEQRELASEVRRIVQARSGGKTAVVRQLHDHYRQMHKEAISDPAIKDWIKPLAIIVETIGFMLNVRSSIKAGARGAKARKMVSTVESFDRRGEKAASKVSYKEEDDKLGIRSVDPTNLVGADAAVVFNTKNRHCEVYLAKPGNKLSIQGARIVNFDESASSGKTLRKPESDLSHWVRATTLKRLEVLSKGIKGKTWEVTGKLNKNCIIVKVL